MVNTLALLPLAAAAALFSLSHALPAPTEADLVPRSCATQGPNIVDILDKSRPNVPAITNQIVKLGRTGGPNSNTYETAISFTFVPPGATGCTLQIEIPPVTAGQIANGTGTQADVWTVDPINFPDLPTWNNPPVRRSFVSTTIFPTGPTTEVYKTNLVSGTCNSTLSYLFRLSDWQQGAGSVQFFNSLGGKQGLVPIGFSLIYNC